MSKQTRSASPAPTQTVQPRDESQQAFDLDTPGFDDDLGEELAETFIENVTGADDAATEHRAEALIEEAGGPFVITSGEEEFADGPDASEPDEPEPDDAEQQLLPGVWARSARQ